MATPPVLPKRCDVCGREMNDMVTYWECPNCGKTEEK